MEHFTENPEMEAAWESMDKWEVQSGPGAKRGLVQVPEKPEQS